MSIEENAFYNCNFLTTILLPESVLSIGSSAFYGCTSLSSVYYSGMVEDFDNIRIGTNNLPLKKAKLFTNPIVNDNYIFILKEDDTLEVSKYLERDSVIVIPSEINGFPVTSIGDAAFRYCTNITEVTIPTGITHLGVSTFDGCTNLGVVTIPEGVTCIDSFVFGSCYNLKTISIPSSVTSIGTSAFEQCTSLENVVLPDGLLNIGFHAFAYCDSLKNIIIPESVTSLDNSVFNSSKSLMSVTILGNITSIGDYMFNECTSLNSVILPNSITNIGDKAFYNCNNLTSINIPASIVSISNEAFTNCSKLKTAGPIGSDVNIQIEFKEIIDTLYSGYVNTNTSQSGSLFSYLEKITIPDNVLTIDHNAFRSCKTLASVTIGNSVTSIGNYAFSGCTNLTSVNIPDSVTSIGDYAFDGCISLYTANIGSGVTTIGNGTFSNCDNLKSVVIPDSVTSLGNGTFIYCKSLTGIIIPSSVKDIGNYMFLGCSNLEEANIEDGIRSIGEAAFSSTGLTSITIPNSVESIGKEAFQSSKLTSVTIPDSVTSVGDAAFQYCYQLATAVIGNNVKAVGNSVFDECTKLTDVTIGDSVRSIGTSAFNKCVNLENITLPDGPLTINNAFGECSKISSLVGKQTIVDTTYISDCASLRIIDVKQLNNVGANTFDGNNTLSKVGIISGESIGSYAFLNCSNLSEVSISNSVKTIGIGAFRYCPNNMTVYFYGTEEEWNNITIKNYNEPLQNATIVFIAPVNEIILETAELTLPIWETKRIEYTTDPLGVSASRFTWSSSDESIATVDQDGNITGVSEGTADITVYVTDGNTSATVTVTVLVNHVTGITVQSESTDLYTGETLQLQAKLEPEDASYKGIVWSSSDDTVASVDENGLVSGKKAGVVTITAASVEAGFNATITLTVLQRVTGIDILEEDVELAIQDRITLNSVVMPEDATNKKVIWETSNSNVAAVDETGVVTGISEGTAVITATSDDGKLNDQCRISVITVHTESISVDNTQSVSEIVYGQTGEIKITFEPANTTNQNLFWSSSDETIATVDENGIITAVGEGTVTITATSEDGGFTASKEINILFNHITGISFTETTADIIVGNSLEFVPVIYPNNASIKTLLWSSSDERVATVDENGKVTAVNGGTATITAETKDGGLTASVEIHVIVQAEKIEFDVEKVEIVKGNEETLHVLFTPENTTNQKVTWTSSDERVATVDENGKVTAVEGGTATITAVSEDGEHKASVEVHVIVHAESISISTEITDLLWGSKESLEVKFTPENTTNQKVTWTSSDESVATVDENGTVTGVGEGTVTITATSEDGGYKATRQIKINLVHIESIEFTETEISGLIGETIQLNLRYLPEDSMIKDVLYSSDNEKIATVDDNGLVSLLAGGKAYITATTKDGDKTATIKVISYPVGITVQELPDYTYTGQAFKPEVKVYDRGKLLTVKTDYTVAYKNNVKAGNASIIIKSNKKGNYKGTQTIYFTIHPADLSEENPDVTVDALSAQATGKTLSPVPVVYFNGKKLKNKTDYTVSYEKYGDRLAPGEHIVTITGKGNFTGTRDITVMVAPKELYSVSKLAIKSKAVKYTDLTGDDFLKEIASVLTVKKGKSEVSGEAYVFEDIPEDYKKIGTINFTLVGKEEYGLCGKRTVSVKITGISLSDKKMKANSALSYRYTGEEIAIPYDTSLLIYNGTPLKEGTDYEITGYSNNINAGTAAVTVKGINNYTGTRKVTFKILPVTTSVLNRDVTIEKAVYCKGGAKPAVTVKDKTEGIDYTVKYSNNTKANTYGTALVTFIGNYKGTPSISKTFYINTKSIAETTITAKDKVYSDKPGGYKSTPVLKDNDGKALKAGVDYNASYTYYKVLSTGKTTVLYSDSYVGPGSIVQVTVSGKGNYTGSVSTTYRILNTGKDISKLSFKIANKEYTGSPVTLSEADILSIKSGKNDLGLKLGRDYEIVSYTNNVNKGTAKVTIRGLNGYGGEKTVSFKIGQRSISDYWKGVKDFFARMF